MVFNMTVVMLNTAMHPMPEGIDFNDAEGQAASIGTLPWMAFVLIPVAHVGQAFFGVLISATITPKASVVVAMIVGVLSMLAGIAKENRISLCGIKPDKASASFFNTNLKHSDAILLVSDLTQAGVCKSLTKLNVRSNELGNEGEAMIRRAVEEQKGFVLEM